MRKGMNNKRFGSRFIAFFVTLAMVLSLCTPFAFAADGTGYGNVRFKSETGAALTEVDTGETFLISAIISYSNPNGGNLDTRLYIGKDISNIVLENFDATEVGQVYGPVDGLTYTICKDDSNDEYYIKVDGIPSGRVKTCVLKARFVKETALDETPFTMTVCQGTQQMDPQNANEQSERTILANADLDWVNLKSANENSIMLDAAATTLSKDITYTIIETAAANINDGQFTNPGKTTLKNGETVLQTYTATDTFTLPEGMYIEGNTDDAIRAAFTFSTNYQITQKVTDNNGNITGFTIQWSENNITNGGDTDNDGAADVPMEPKTYTATLKSEKVKVNADYKGGSISNTVQTEFTTKKYGGDDVKNTTPSASATTFVSRDGTGMGEVKKYLQAVEGSNKHGWVYNDQIGNYVVQGDILTYRIEINNNSTQGRTYTVTDNLASLGLEYNDICRTTDKWGNKLSSEGTSLGTVQENGGNITFDVTIPAGGFAVIEIEAIVKDDTTAEGTTIQNKANVKLDGITVDIETNPIPQQPTTPEVYIEKIASGLADGTVFENGDTFDYVIKVENRGTGASDAITVEDVLPDGITLNGTVTPSEFTVNDKTVSGTISSLAKGESVEIRIPVTVNAPDGVTSITNTATAKHNNEELTASVSIEKNKASVLGLAIDKRADQQIVGPNDEVTYTITVTNPYGNGTLKDATFNVVDFIPDAMEYVEGSVSGSGSVMPAVTRDENRNPVFTFNNVTIGNNESITFTIKCKVKSDVDADSDYDNTVVIYDGSTPGGSDTDKNISGEGTASDSSILIEKDALVNGESIDGKSVAPGTQITYTLKITNNGTEPLENFEIKDTFVGDYVKEDTYNVFVDLVYNEVDSEVSWVNGYDFGENNRQYTEIKNGDSATNGGRLVLWQTDTFTIKAIGVERYQNGWTTSGSSNTAYNTEAYLHGLSIPQGKSMMLSYTLTTASTFTGGSNTVVMTAGKDTSNDSVSYTKGEAAPEPEQPIDPDYVPKPEAKLTITKTATKDAYSISESTIDSAISKIDAIRTKYTVTVTNTSDKDYVTDNATFTDTLPAGWVLAIKNNADDVDKSQYNLALNTDLNPVQIIGSEPNDNGLANTIYVTQDTIKRNYDSNIFNGGTQYYLYPVEITVKNDKTETVVSNFALNALKNNNTGLSFDYGIPSDANYEIPGSTLTVKFGTLTIPAGKSLTFTYYLAPTDSEVASFQTEMTKNNAVNFADRDYKNEAEFAGSKAFYDENNAAVNDIHAVEHVTFTVPKIHPGISKAYSGHVASNEDVMGGTNTAVTLKEYLEWTVKVYNGRDSAGDGLTMSNYTVTDTWPAGYEYAKDGHAAYTKRISKYDVYGNKTDLDVAYYVEPNAKGEFVFKDEKYALAPGESLEFTILTKPSEPDKSYEYGLYTNTVVLNVNGQTIYDDAVVSGTHENGGITTDATVPIYLVSTSSKKYIKKDTDEEYTVNSESDALENRIQASMGDVITYKLEVSNHDTQNHLEDFVIIDRLPYVGDKGVISTEAKEAPARGSAFPLQYEGNVKAKITLNDGTEYELNNTYIDISFASDNVSAFTSTDLDWVVDTSVLRAAQTRVVWIDEPSVSTDLVRFGLVNLENHPNADVFKTEYEVDGVKYTKYGVPESSTITIEFDAKIPDYVQSVGEGNIAWNSFGYYFNSGDNENMVAEPGKVGVWVEDENYGGSILVRKIYKTNMPNKVRTFYFALFEGMYDGTSLENRIDTVKLDMTGSEAGAQATTYFTNIDYDKDKSNAYYIYETDSNYVPLVADSVEKENVTYKADDGTTEQVTITTSKTVSHDGYTFTMDNQSQMDSALGKPNKQQYDKEAEHYNTNYLVWHKDLSRSKPTNSAIFTNTYIATVDKEIMGPFYADVPTDASVASSSSHNMTSTRPESFHAGEISETVSSTSRNESYATEATYSAAKAGTAYGGDQKHTIATGFLSKITAIGDYTIEQAQWKITTSNPNDTSDGKPGVFVRLRTEQPQGYGLRLMYLDEFEVFEEESEGKVELGSVGGFEDISDDENFLSDYTVEERAAMIAESLGIDPANIQYDDYGVPYVEMDEELQDEAFALSEVTEPTGTTESSFSKEGSSLRPANFSDARSTTGYAIWKLEGDPRYSMEFNDNIPHITLAAGAQAYVGIVIDQLYDQKATATLEISDVPLYDDDTMIKAANAANGDNGDNQYTMVKSPFQKGGFSIGALLKLTPGTKMEFNNFVTETTKSTQSIQNANNTMRITATDGKNITVNVNAGGVYNYKGWSGNEIVEASYTTYLGLNGSGRKDYRSIVVNAEAGTTLRFIARSTGSDARTLVVEDSAGEKQNIKVPGKGAADEVDVLKEQTVTIKTAGAVYIYSANSGIDVFSVEIVQ